MEQGEGVGLVGSRSADPSPLFASCTDGNPKPLSMIEIVSRTLFQVFQVSYVILKTSISPRPGNWILERSLDNETYTPWQYYAISDEECLSFYGMIAARQHPLTGLLTCPFPGVPSILRDPEDQHLPTARQLDPRTIPGQ